MKKLLVLLLPFLVSGQVLSADSRQNFQLLHEVPHSCFIQVTSDDIGDTNLILGKPTEADLTFNCNDLDGVKLVLSSLNGGLKKGTDTTHLIHYFASIKADDLNPDPLTLDTEVSGTADVSGTFEIDAETTTINGDLTVTLKTPTTFTPGVGRYEDTLSVILRAPLAPPTI